MLSDIQDKAVALRIEGMTWSRIATQLGVAPSTIYRWRQNEEFINKLEFLNNQWIRGIESNYHTLIESSLLTLHSISVDTENTASERIQACDKILHYVSKNRENQSELLIDKLEKLYEK